MGQVLTKLTEVLFSRFLEKLLESS